MQAYFETADGVLINYTIHREGRRPVVFLHGWGGNQLSLVPTISSLKGDYTVVTYDHRGFGKSGHPVKGYSIERLADDLKELLDHLELRDVLLVGWSMGGVTATTYMDKYKGARVSGLVLVDVNARIMSDETFPYGFYNGTYTKEDCLEDVTKMAKDFRLFAQEMPVKGDMRLYDEAARAVFVDRVVEQNLNPNPCIAMWLSIAQTDLIEPYKRLDVPILFCHGGTSQFCSSEACAFVMNLLKDARLVEFPECSHFIAIERPQKLAEAIDQFAADRLP